MELTQLVEHLKKRGYKYVPTGFFVSKQFCNIFNLQPDPQTIQNPVSSKKNCITSSRKYFDLIYKMVNYQHLKKPLKVYSFISNAGYDEISGITLSKGENPLPYLKQLLFKQYEFELVEKQFFKLVHKSTSNNSIFEVGLFDNIKSSKTLKDLGYRDMPDIVYFMYKLSW